MAIPAPTFKPRRPVARPVSRTTAAQTAPTPTPIPTPSASNPVESLIDDEPDYHDPDLAAFASPTYSKLASQISIRATPVSSISARPIARLRSTVKPIGTPLRPAGVPLGTPGSRSGTPIAIPREASQIRDATPIPTPGLSVRPSRTSFATPSGVGRRAAPAEQPTHDTISTPLTTTESSIPTPAAANTASAHHDSEAEQTIPAEQATTESTSQAASPEENTDKAPSGKKRGAPAETSEPSAKRRKSTSKKAAPIAPPVEAAADAAGVQTQVASEQVEGGTRRSARVAARKQPTPPREPSQTVEESARPPASEEQQSGEVNGVDAASAVKGKGKKAAKGSRKGGKKRKFNFMDIDENGHIPGFDDEPAQEAQADESTAVEGAEEPPRKKPRNRRLNIDDMNLDPGEPLDAGTTRMADLIEDPGVGYVSNKFVEVYKAKQRLNEERKKERDKKRRELVERKQKQMDGVHVEPQNVNERARAALGDTTAFPALTDGAAEPAAAEGEEEGFRETHTAPQIRIGANGEWTIDEESTQIDRAADPTLPPTEEYETIIERDTDRFVNSLTFSRKIDRRGPRWAREEVELLCKGVSMFGYDFEMISKLFVGRSRNMVKNKWKRIEKDDPVMAQNAWESRTAIDLSYYSKHVGANLLVAPKPIIIGPVEEDAGPAAAETNSDPAQSQHPKGAGGEATPEAEDLDLEQAEKEQEEGIYEEVPFDVNGPEFVFDHQRESESPPPVEQLCAMTAASN